MTNQIKSLLHNQSLHKFGIYGFGQFFNLVTPLIVVPYIIAICGEENFGKTAIALAVAFFLIVFVDFGADIIGTKEVSIHRFDKEKLNDILSTTYGVKLVMLLIVLPFQVCFFFFIPYLYNEKALFQLSLFIVVGQFINPTWFLQGVEHITAITFTNILSKVIYLLGVFFTVKTESDYIYVNFWWGIGMIISFSIAITYLFYTEKFQFSMQPLSHLTAEIKKNFKLFSSQIFVSLQLYAPILIIGFIGNAVLAGQYRIIEQVIIIFKTYLLLFFNFIYPKVCYLTNHHPQQVKKTWLVYNGLNYFVIIVLVIGISTFSKEVIAYFNPENPEALVKLLYLAVLLPLTLGVSIPLKQLVLAKNYDKYYANLTILFVLLSLALIIILLPIYQLYGVFFSLIFAEILTIFFYIYRLKKSH